MNKKQVLAWAAFDWANSAVNTLVFTFVFSVYFAKSIYGDQVAGSAAWSFAQGCAGVVIAILSPILGAALDRYGPHKPVLKLLTIFSCIFTVLLFFMEPSHNFVFLALLFSALLTVFFELLQNVYNSTLPIVTAAQNIGKVSGIGWGFGYVGSIVCLTLALLLFIGLGDSGGFFGIPKDEALHVRSTMLLTAVWFAVFSIPFFLICPDAAKSGLSLKASVLKGIQDLKGMVRELRQHREGAKFLLASAIYRDGLATLFAIGGLYAAGTLQMSFSEVMMFAIVINIASGIGAIGFAFLDKRLGARGTVILSLVALIVVGLCAIGTNDKFVFIGLTCLLGVFIGTVQAASRTWLVALAPLEKKATFFGLYALSGKAVAFMGPFAFAALTTIFESQRAGMLSIIAFWIVGLMLVYSVRSHRAHS